MRTQIKWRATAANNIAKNSTLVVGVYAKAKSVVAPRAVNIYIKNHLKRGDFAAQVGDTQMLYPSPGGRVLLVGLGAQDKFDTAVCKRVAVAAIKHLDKNNVAGADFYAWDGVGINAKRSARILAESGGVALYKFTATKNTTLKNKGDKFSVFKSAVFHCAKKNLDAVKTGLREGSALANAAASVCDYANLPGNICTPTYLAGAAKKLAKELPIKTTVLDEAQMKKLKMGSLLSVSRGSREPAKLIIMEYRGGKKNARPVVLVGKGLTFDAGGISIKPSNAMDEMKFDMCGGATVLGAMQAVAELKLKLNVVGIVPSSENLPDGAANKPGDIVTSMAGITIEILNTDAEGRLILCDALTYAKRYKPAAVVDIATLTGACVIALGDQASGLFSNDDALADELLAAGDLSCDRAWRLPLWDSYDEQLKSNFADFANIGGRGAGSVTAACFLKQFTSDYAWAHLDVAGTAWRGGADKGATARPLGLLVEFLLRRAENARAG